MLGMAKRVPVPAQTDYDFSRLSSKVKETPSGCWEWTGGKFQQGYGLFKLEEKSRRAHRVLYVWTNGELPEGLELDHACNNRACVRPHSEHVRPLTQKANVKRANASSPTVANSNKNECLRGHAFTEENTYVDPSNGARQCIQCRQTRGLGYWRAKNPGFEARRATETHCHNGHEWTPENTAFQKGGSKQCRACHREVSKRYNDKKRAAKNAT